MGCSSCGKKWARMWASSKEVKPTSAPTNQEVKSTAKFEQPVSIERILLNKHIEFCKQLKV